MDARAIIAAVRDHKTPSPEELAWFARGLADKSVSDAQAGAFAMAVVLNGLDEQGRIALTEGMRDSGDVLRWDLPGPVLDKHSTGGVGDCVSLILAPVLAACGAYVPMISGRGLGHTGGTLDKLEAIPGVNINVSEQQLRLITREVGCAIVSATSRIAPADRRLYAVRDVTSTVESVDLITASILSKKLAAGLNSLVLDIKCGTGAFMKTPQNAIALAQALVTTANGAGCRTAGLITDMNEPLAPALGNALEVAVCMEVLSGNTDAAPRLYELTVALCTQLLMMQGEDNPVAGRKVKDALRSGAAMERFAHMIAAMGGPPDMAQDWPTHLPKAPIVGEVTAATSGHISAINGEALGLAVVALGGGRQVETDKIDPSVGLSDVIGLGAHVNRGDPLCVLHAADEDTAISVAEKVRAAFTIGEATTRGPLILEGLA
ncbi:thymidine phosphorylase [Yoonia litorea]|uniref:Thymidine phosphorylase n=1 Tax=Yoonia litorea TaxID=1123755 RepID=A0A1I6MJ23_9RHOB|nr:thymidine phosphorylase [Yoonia litorea]SFS15652.1 thymidine phosphorylase [Yoonia litorea]